MTWLAYALPIGIGATLVMDGWALLLRRAYGVKTLDYALVGRWLGTMPAGRFVHADIARAPARSHERAIGWAAHYAIGIGFAALLLALAGPQWLAAPDLYVALGFGLLTIGMPFFVMQPAMGLGPAAAHTPDPQAARLRSLVTHLVFGFGLYAASMAMVALTGGADHV